MKGAALFLTIWGVGVAVILIMALITMACRRHYYGTPFPYYEHHHHHHDLHHHHHPHHDAGMADAAASAAAAAAAASATV
ncbi:hypothetical protein Nepgr_003394 [Nepenthes gracilis]|uniref:Uncharacterized protein n=1 Tax=Nepenthes gracilis TaxID=150966 RepID=A0AAD3RZH2_NEPGR|nr:hypothetical protein Nepgr_003394 [Nepenthes gracilis]